MHDVKPYVVSAAEHVVFGPWCMNDPESPGIELVEDFEGWDPQTDIDLTRHVDIDVDAVRAETRIPNDVPLRLVAGWHVSTSGMSGLAGQAGPVHPGATTLRARLLGTQVGGTLTLRTSLVVGRNWDGPVGAPREAGSVLTSDEFRLSLEAVTSMFPIEVVDFAGTRFHPKASWHLTLNPDMDKPFLGACWLSLNSRDGELIDAISARKPNARQDAIISDMNHGVAQAMLEVAEMAEHQIGLSGHEWPSDSVGDVLARYVETGGQAAPRGSVTLEDVMERHALRAGRARSMGFGRSFR